MIKKKTDSVEVHSPLRSSGDKFGLSSVWDGARRFSLPPNRYPQHAGDRLANAQTADCTKQDRTATPDLNCRRAVNTAKKLSYLFPRRLLRQVFVTVETGCIDGPRDACGAPTSAARVAKERAQRLYMERDAGPVPPAGHGTGEVLG